MAAKCNKFLPNIFNKAKCQHCFGAKEAHSAEALENNKASRKVSKCGYLFVSPGFDFNNPLDRTKRWQRRFFILYDDGEFSYSVDENPDTVPQGTVDMNKCTDVLDAEKTTSHTNSLSIITPDKTLYIKGNSKEEIQWWHDILGEFPKALKAIKPRRKMPYLIMSNKENMQPDSSVNGKNPLGDTKGSMFDGDKLKNRADVHAYSTFRGVRSLKHKYDSNHQEGLRKSSSLHDLSTEDKDLSNRLESSRFLSRSGDRLDMMSRDNSFSLAGSSNKSASLPISPYVTIPKSTWTRTGQPIPSSFISPGRSHPPNTLAATQFNSSSSISSTSSTNSSVMPHRRGSVDDPSGSRPSSERSSGRLRRERSSSLKDFPTQFSVARSLGEDIVQQPHGYSADETDSNETDELKDLAYMKKGWLIKQGSTEKESKKHWFVLTGNSLRYYKEAKAEECNALDGRIDLTTCYEVAETNTHRNYGFKIKTRNGEYVLAAMTSGIRTNWMKAIRLFMEIHNSTSRQGSVVPKPGQSGSKFLTPPRTLDDFDLKNRQSTISTAAVKGASGETAFQLVGRKESSYKRETQKPARRHHSDVNPGNVSKAFTLKEFTSNLDSSSQDPLAASGSSSHSSDSHRSSQASLSPASSISIGRDSGGLSRMNRFVEGSDSLPVSIAGSGSGLSANEQQQVKLNQRPVASESTKEEGKRAMMRRAKSPSARVRDKTRASKSTTRLTSPINISDDAYRLTTPAVLDPGMDSLDGSILTDVSVSEDEYPVVGGEDKDQEEVTTTSSVTALDIGGGDDALVDILEKEVDSLKDRLRHTQTELDKVHKDNQDLKTRYHKESTQSVDSGYSNSSSRWSQGSSSTQPDMLKRQLKESKDTVQRQKLDIESLKSKLDMSVSKLTGTEKALSEALRDYKQEKDKFLKLSTEWNRRIRTLESSSKENTLKLERSRENLQAKERECRRLEVELKSSLQRTREQEKEVLKLKAVEHEYNQLKEKLDDREHDLCGLRAELKEKEHNCNKIKDEHERQIEEMEREYGQERDDLEHHIEQLKNELYHAHDRQTSMTDNMTSNMADICSEKDDIIAQLEEKMIEADKKLVDLSDEFQAEMGENADLAHTIELLQEDKIKLEGSIDSLEGQLVSVQAKMSAYQKENFSLRKQLEELRMENSQLHQSLEGKNEEEAGNEEQETLKKTIRDMNCTISDLQTKLQDADSLMVRRPSTEGGGANSSMSSVSSLSSDHQQDLLHNVLVVDSQLKDVNSMLLQLRQNFDAYLDTIPGNSRGNAIKLADLVEDIGHRCQDIQDSLHGPQENVKKDKPEAAEDEKILADFKGLQSKFDVVTAEVKKVKKDYENIQLSYKSLGKENSKLKEDLGLMEGVLKPQVVDLISKVNNLSDHIVNVQTGATRDVPLMDTLSWTTSSVSVVSSIHQNLQQLDTRIKTLEQQVSTVGNDLVSSQSGGAGGHSAMVPPAEHEGLVIKLEDIRQQVEEVNAKLDTLTPFPSDITGLGEDCLTQLGDYKERIVSLTKTLQSLAAAKMSSSQKSVCKESTQTDSDLAKEGVSSCLLVIKERIQEVGELLDSLEEDGEDSDSEEGGEQTGVDDVREKLSSLTEYIEQHSKMSTSEWAVLRLLNVQKSTLCSTKEVIDGEGVVSEEEKLQLYSDRLSLEAVILSEMANLVQEKDFLSPDDPVSKEIDTLNSQVLLLHYQLSNETKTMHFDLPQADLMAAYTQLMAEKILVNGQLYINSLEEGPNSQKQSSSDTTPSLQPVFLATEALVRSQIDSYIGENLDRSSEELLTLPTHLTARALVQGDLSYALTQLKRRLNQNPQVLCPGQANYEFMFHQLEDRQRKVMESLEHYEKQLIHSLAVIIWKESEEMTIVDIPESVLDAMCSELSTIMEKHIQRYKEMCRSTTSTHTAHKYDIIVNEIRMNREAVLTQIKRHYEAYSKDQSSIRDSSLDVPVQSLDDTINNFGEILSLKAIVKGSMSFLVELLKMGSSVLEDIDLEQDESRGEESVGSLEKNLANFVSNLSEALTVASASRAAQSKEIVNDQSKSEDGVSEGKSVSQSERVCDLVRRMPSLSSYPEKLSDKAALVVREAVFSAQITFFMLKLKLAHERDLGQMRLRRPVKSSKPQTDGEESKDSEDTLDLQTDYEALLMPLEEVLECKHVDEVEVLQVLLSQVKQMRADLAPSATESVSEQLLSLEQKLHHEVEVAAQRHKTHLEVFKQETAQLEKNLEDQQQDKDHFEERCMQLEEELSALQAHHEDDKERMKQDILTAVHAIKSNDEKSETQLMEKASKLNKELSLQKLSFKRWLSALRNDVSSRDKDSVCQIIDTQVTVLSQAEEEEEEDYQPPLPEVPPPDMVDSGKAMGSGLEQSLSASDLHAVNALDLSHHEHEVEQLKKEKEEALAEEMRNTKAALDAMRKAYEEELVIEKSKYKEALVTMYTEDYVNEIRLRHQEEEEHQREEVQKLTMHYSGKCEDYKLMEMRLEQVKQDYESHIKQLIQSNTNLEEMLSREIDSIKDFIKQKPSLGSLTTGAATIEEELYDAKIMVRVKDAELQKLRAQVKTQENNLQRTTEEQRQTMTLYMQSLKNASEAKKEFQEEKQQLTEKLNKVLGSQGLKANIKRTPSFHQRARSPSPQPSSSPRKDSDHSSRESNRRRHIQPKDLRRSKSSPSLPYVFDAKGAIVANKPSTSKLSRRSRSPKN